MSINTRGYYTPWWRGEEATSTRRPHGRPRSRSKMSDACDSLGLFGFRDGAVQVPPGMETDDVDC